MIRWLLILLVTLPFGRAGEMTQSQSRVFNIYSPSRSIYIGAVPAGSVALEAELLAITADRVREAVVGQIPALGVSRNRIHLHLMDQIPNEPVIGIFPTRFNDGWNYRLAVPPVVDRSRLVRALVQVLLLEYAQRVGEKPAEIPAWLVEGMTQQIFHTVGASLVVNRGSSGWEASVSDLTGRTRDMLRTNTAPSFHDLTTLAPPPPGAAAVPFYESCTHFLVRSLLGSPNGKQKFAAFLQMLPLTWNWQTSFRQAFGFEKMLDVEKWWALVTVEFTTRDQRQAWSPPVSLQRLDELLTTRMEWRASQSALPQTRIVTLQSMLRDVDWTLQRTALNEKISQLTYTAPHLAPQIGALALEYRKVLDRYVRDRDGSAKPSLRMTPEALQQKLVVDTIRRLDTLDIKRKGLTTTTLSAR
jgi:hypothetical protein